MRLSPDLLDRLVKSKLRGCSSSLLARNLGVSRQRVNQLWREYRLTGVVPVLEKVGRKTKLLSNELVSIVLRAKREFGFGARVLERLIRERYKVKLPHNKIHEVLLMNGLAGHCLRKQKRRKWVRYEREHSLTAAHMDWYKDSVTRKHVCILLDDASRKILSAG
jgi:putative transposase